jgi:hypothetical protein
MSLIFDAFENRDCADEFCNAVEAMFGLETQVFMTVEASDAHDPFPFGLKVPIVHVERPGHGKEGDRIERRLERMVTRYKGLFAGT